MEPAHTSFVKTLGFSVAAGLIAVILYAMGVIFFSTTDPKLADDLGASPQLYFYVGSGMVFALVTGLVLAGMMVRRWRKSRQR